MPAEIDRLLAEAAAAPARPVDPASLRTRARRARRRDRVLAGLGVLAVVAVGGTAVLGGTGDLLQLAPQRLDIPVPPGADAPWDGPTPPALPTPAPRPEPSALPRPPAPGVPAALPGADALVRPGEPVALPPPGEVLPIWVETAEEGPTPVFVVREPGGAVHALVATARFIEGVDTAVGWCAEGAAFVEWRGGSVFGPDGSYRGGPSPTGLERLDAAVDGQAVRLGELIPGSPRGEARQAWTREGTDGCLTEDPTAGLLLHGLPGVAFAEAAAAAPLAGQVVMNHPSWPADPMLVEGTLVLAPDASPRLCDPLPQDSPPACPGDAWTVRGATPRGLEGRWAETGLFRVHLVGGQEFLGVVTVTADVSHAEEQTEPPLVPPLADEGRVLVEGDTIIVPAVDVDLGEAPEPVPAGRYLLRLDNSGHLPHTLVNAALGVDLRAEGRDRDRTTVDLPPGEHLFVCEIPGHTPSMQLTLTVIE